MNAEQKNIALEELVENEGFISEILEASGKDQIQQIFLAHGFELSKEELDAFVSTIAKEASGELNESALEDVAGGVARVEVLKWMWKAAKAVAKPAWNLGKKFADWEESLYK